ncbi:AAA family ATPase [Nocardioides sp. STR2]|uniref:AAA family ATPase n=1 Tax=Nocardioides pini TaxID=2975053 RepID=A0ABT4CBY8_9ACTN|nr:AAA family ATPase [Nocardioides pini]MCY4726482.1 AAA family ATPase [Nocardioides pini]
MAVTRARMVGRERELQALRGAAGIAAEGAVRTVLVLGEPGVGKTRLAEELARSLGAPWLCLTSHGVPLDGTEVPFGGAAELVRAVTRALGPAEVRRRVGRDAPVLGLLVPAVADPPADHVDRADIMAAVLRLVEALDRPVCWLADDAQWLDRATRDLLLYAERVATCPLLIVATIRTSPDTPGGMPQALAELGRRADVVQLGPLSGRQVVEQIAELDESLPADVVNRICVLSDGMPYYVEQLVTARGEVAGSLHAVLQARLDQLSAPAREVLAAAAVGEGLLTPSGLRAVSGLGDDFTAALSEVRGRGLLVLDPTNDGLRFHHALLRDAVERTVLAEDRRRWHEAWACYLDALAGRDGHDLQVVMERARHHDAAGTGDAFTSALAAARAADLTQDDQARSVWWHRAFARWPAATAGPDGLTRDAALSRAYAALWSVGDLHDIEDLLERELADEQDWFRSLWLRLLLWRAQRAMLKEYGRVVPPSEAEATLTRLRAREVDCTVAEVTVHLADEWLQDLPDLAEAMLHRVVDDLSEVADVGVLADAWDLLGWLECCRGDPDAAVLLAERQLAWTRRRHPARVLHARCVLLNALVNAERTDDGLLLADETLAVTRDPHLHPHLWVVQHMLRAVMHLWTGAWQETRDDLDHATEGRLGGDIASWWNAVAGIRSARIGDVDAARVHLDAIPAPPPGTPPGQRWSQEAELRAILQAEVAAAEGDGREVCLSVLRAVTLHHPGDPPDTLCNALVSGLRSGVDRAPVDPEARALARDATTFHTTAPPGRNVVHQLRRDELAEHLRRVDDDDTTDRWWGIATRWTARHRPYDAAHALLFAAECAVRDDDRTRARDLLGEAHALADRLGAQPLRRRVEALARSSRVGAVGHPPGSHGLTPRESDVLDLLVDGLTNREIAQQLGMSPKTVSVHVSHLIAKLGVANRTEAAARAVRDDLTGER